LDYTQLRRQGFDKNYFAFKEWYLGFMMLVGLKLCHTCDVINVVTEFMIRCMMLVGLKLCHTCDVINVVAEFMIRCMMVGLQPAQHEYACDLI
jgi:hypothetical protein